ncbi:unnamed protein product [Rotaria magnacalcarata]|uniref:Uncharacterized protein n=1 Tax=Rotaria magnacalcarata TaxID=392030 RepID=A0A8S2KCP0_9BILA|nr:unnamed protein product [Rotaria magnacalcarata]CAF3847803.1 unnamed protein product [Rotaria magnacalcarata]CAF3892072.1 unnamed protein product [Rotaria magnacalcarata]
MIKEPQLYGVSNESLLVDKYLFQRCLDLIHFTAIQLDTSHLIHYDRKTGSFQITEHGRIAKIPKEIIRKIEKKNISWGTFYDLDAREIDVNNKMVEEQEVPNIELYLESNRLSLKLSIRRNANGQYITPVEENDQGSNTVVCSIEYDNATPALRGFTADIRCPCTAVTLPLLKRLNTA